MTTEEQIALMNHVLMAIHEYVLVTDHLFDGRDEPRPDYQYDDDAVAWERMVTPRNNIKALLSAFITYE